jgi:raffinose/stachyose/melibiose transport system permease protein
MSQKISTKEAVQAGGVVGGARRFALPRSLRDAATGYAFVLPALLVYLFFVVYPFFNTIYLSLTKWDGAQPVKEFVGLANYQALIADSRLWGALSHNLIWVILGTVTPIAIGLFLGLLLWHGVRGMVFFRIVYFLPVVLAPVAVGIIWTWIYNPQFGPINTVLKEVGLGFLAKGWLGDPDVALPALIAAGVWGYFGFCFVVIMAGLQNVDMNQIDAALVDGANAWQRLIYVIIPELRQVLTMITAFTLILGVNVFDIVWITTRGGPGRATQVIATFTYTTAFRQSYVGYGAALAVVMALVSLVASFIFITIRERGE